MSYSRRTEAEGRRGRLTSTSITTSGVRDVESTEVMSNDTDTIVDQRSAGTGTTDSEMSITDTVDEDRDLDASTVTKPRMQHGGGDSEKGLGGVAPFVERNPDKVASTLEWRGSLRGLHSQLEEATQVTNTRPQLTAEERWRASFEMEVERRREHYPEQENLLVRETVRQERCKWAMKELEEEENDEDGQTVAEWWELRSVFQPTECGYDGSR